MTDKPSENNADLPENQIGGKPDNEPTKLHSEWGPAHDFESQDEISGFMDSAEYRAKRIRQNAEDSISQHGIVDVNSAEVQEELDRIERIALQSLTKREVDAITPGAPESAVTPPEAPPSFNERVFAGMVAKAIADNAPGLQIAWRHGADGRAGNMIDAWFPGTEHGLRIQVTEGPFGEPVQKQGTVLAMQATENGVRAYKVGFQDGSAVTAFQAEDATPLLPQEECMVTATQSGYQVSPLPNA